MFLHDFVLVPISNALLARDIRLLFMLVTARYVVVAFVDVTFPNTPLYLSEFDPREAPRSVDGVMNPPDASIVRLPSVFEMNPLPYMVDPVPATNAPVGVDGCCRSDIFLVRINRFRRIGTRRSFRKMWCFRSPRPCFDFVRGIVCLTMRMFLLC